MAMSYCWPLFFSILLLLALTKLFKNVYLFIYSYSLNNIKLLLNFLFK
jgi:hypothetical protein